MATVSLAQTTSPTPGAQTGHVGSVPAKKTVVKKNPRPARNFDFGLNPTPAPVHVTDPHFLSLLQAPWLKQLAQGKSSALGKPSATPTSKPLKRAVWATHPLNPNPTSASPTG